jgi:hypothetical protein
MAYPPQPADTSVQPLPVPSAYNPITAVFKAVRGWNKITDATPNDSYAIALSPEDGGKATYSAAATAIVPATTAGAIFTLRGSATANAVVRLTRCHVSGIATTAITIDVTLEKWSAAPSGGTAITAPTMVPHDSASGAAGALVAGYTVAPTRGTLVGVMRSSKLALPLTASSQGPDIEWEFGVRPSQCVVLRGNTQYAAILISAIPAGGSIDVSMEWTEDIGS